ncbi:MAG: DUF393 domain-containing protein [Planctomycetes bacterium]|nr:DUF393 domain-containing protein [Planctomycetota bacterium]
MTSEKNSDVKRPSSSATAERTGPIIFFDGVCGLCNRSVDFVLARDGDEQFRFAPLQGETAQAALSAPDIQTLGSLVFVSESGTSRHSTAIVRILWKLGGIWSFWAVLLWLIPWPLRHLGYKIIGANRYRLFGKRETCRMPTPQERSRFLP